MNILITGGAGFIGTKLANKLAKKNKIYILDFPEKIKEKSKYLKNCKLLNGDIRNKNIFLKINNKIDLVYHLAALCSTEMSEKYPRQCYATNVEGTKNLLKWCVKKKVKKIIFTSSMAVYGRNSPNIQESTKCKPVSVYGKTKLMGEKILLSQQNKIKTIILRLFNVYGPDQDLNNEVQGMFSIYLKHAITYKKIFVKGSLNRVRDFVYIDDVVSALKHNFKSSNIYNVGTGKPSKVINVIKSIFKNLKIKFKKNLIQNIKKHKGDTHISYANIGKLKKIGWAPKYNLQKGSKKTISKINSWK